MWLKWNGNLKTKLLQRKMKISILIVMFFLIGAFFIISNNNLKFTKAADRQQISNLYKAWLGSVAENTIGSVGYVTKMDWLPEKNKQISKEDKKKQTDNGKLQEERNEWEE